MATLLGLLLVVTFIANYLSTTLPNQMSVNDLNHEVEVENQLGRLQALLDSASVNGLVSAQLSQPITLGSDADPPFAGADSGWLSPLNLSETLSVNYTLHSAALSPSTFNASVNSAPAAGFVVHLQNTYAPLAEIAFDAGAVVYAQSGGFPLLFDAPEIQDTGKLATIWMPIFNGTVPSESGTGSADLLFRLVSLQVITFPASGFSLAPNTHVTVTVNTPYAAAWMTYFNATSPFAGHATCTAATQALQIVACTGAYKPGDPIGRVILSLPVVALNLDVALFSVTLS